MSTNASSPKGATAPRKKGNQPPRVAANRGNKPLVRPAPRSKVRRARLVIAKVDTWSVAKLIFLLSVAVGIVTVVATVILWLVMQATGAFDGINELISLLGTTGNTIHVDQILSLGQVALFATIISVVNVVLMTLLGVVAAMLYNVAAKLVGGIGVTLTDD